MDTYSFLRQIADSWVLLAMFGFLIGAYVWAFLPSQSKARQEASLIPFRAEPQTAPDMARAVAPDTTKPCLGTCDTCAAKRLGDHLKGENHV